MITNRYRIYGATGHRQKETFNPSKVFDFSTKSVTVILDIRNSDVTGTNEYTEIIVTAPTEHCCFNEVMAQITDGIFENNRVGRIEYVGTVNTVPHLFYLKQTERYQKRCKLYD